MSEIIKVDKMQGKFLNDMLIYFTMNMSLGTNVMQIIELYLVI